MCRKESFTFPVVAVVMIILFGNHIGSQGGTVVAQESGGMGYSMFGSNTINLDDLNAKLASHGYTTLSDNFFSVGGGGHGIINSKWIIGGEGGTLLGDNVTSGDYETSLIVGYGLFDVGYIVYSIKDLRVYPLLGIGAGGMTLSIAQSPTSLSFDEVLDNPKRNVEMTTGGFLLNIALGIDYLLAFDADEKGRGGFLLGLRGGYCFSPIQSDWTLGEIELSGAPETAITGPYIRLIIGGGGIGKI